MRAHRLRRTKQHQLLWQRLLEIRRREAQAFQAQLQVADAPCRAVQAEQHTKGRRRVPRGAYCHLAGDQRQRMTTRLGQRLLLRAAARLANQLRRGFGTIDHRVRVAAAEAEGIDRRTPRTGARLPLGGRGRQEQGAAGERVHRMLDAHLGRRGHRVVLEGAADLQHPGAGTGRNQVPELRLQRTELQRMIFAEHRAEAEHLLAVADRGARGVALEVLDARRFQSRGRIRGAHRALLSRRGGRQQPGPAAVVAEADAAHDAVDAIAGGHRVIEALQRQHGGAFRRQQSVGERAEWRAAAGAAERTKGGEADVKEQIVRGVEARGDHQVGAPRLQRVAGNLQGVEARGAGGVERDPRATEAARSQGPVQNAGLSRQRRAVGVQITAPAPGGHIRQCARGIAEGADDEAGARAAVHPERRLVQRLARGVNQPLPSHWQWRQLFRRDREAIGPPQRVEAAHVSAAGARARLARIGADLCGMQSPHRLRARTGQIVALADARPQAARVERARQHASASDDGDGNGRRHDACTCITMPSSESSALPVARSVNSASPLSR